MKMSLLSDTQFDTSDANMDPESVTADTAVMATKKMLGLRQYRCMMFSQLLQK